MTYHTSLTVREATFFDYLYKKMQEKQRDYVNTNYYYVKNIAGYKNIPGARYLVKNLAKKKLIVVQEGINWKGRQFLRIKIGKPLVVKKLLAEYNSQKSTEREEASPASRNEIKDSKTTLPINNNIINQINHSEEKRKITIVQDMLKAYNEVTNGTVSPSRELAPMLVAAYKQKFKTLERWRQYLRHKVWGKIKDTFRFLVKILGFSIINAAMGEMGMAESLPKYTSEAAFNHVETLREAPSCLDVRKKLIERRGAGVYFSWFTKAKLKEEDGHIVACGDNSFITEHLNTQFRLELERYYDEWVSKQDHFAGSGEIKETEQEEIDMEALGQVVGHVGSCEIKEGKRGKVMKLSVSHTESSKKENGTWDTKTTWYQVYYTGDRRVEYLGELKKGDLVIVRGDLRTLEGIRQDGTPYTTICIMAEKVKRLFKAKSVEKA